MQIIEPNSPQEFSDYFNKRWEILRKPWGQPKGTEIDNYENLSLHVMVVDAKSIIGVGRLTYFNTGEGQIRYMGVDETKRNQKTGSTILNYLEEKARNMGLNRLFLNARTEAVKFYKHNGYTQDGDVFKGFANIDHYKMIKKL